MIIIILYCLTFVFVIFATMLRLISCVMEEEAPLKRKNIIIAWGMGMMQGLMVSVFIRLMELL